MSAEGGARRDPFTLFLVVACSALAVLVVLLALQNRSLKARIAEVGAAGPPPPNQLKAGDVVPSFEIADAAGVRSPVAFPWNGKTLLLVFSSTCRACQDTIPLWDKLIGQGLPPGVRVVGIQTDLAHAGDAAAVPLAIPALAFPVHGPAVPRDELMTKFPFIPGAAVLDGGGRVLGVWFGVPTDTQLAELSAALR